ncbi:MAG TPA: GtrA family protein [Cyclobacteriaceae bacterium]
MQLIFKLIKFCIVGGCGMILDFGLTFLLKEKIKINRYISNSIGFLSAASLNYLLNRYWTFESQSPHISQEYLLFMFFALVGLGINTLFLYLFERKLGYNFYIAKFFAILVTTTWNFTTNYFFNFH